MTTTRKPPTINYRDGERRWVVAFHVGEPTPTQPHGPRRFRRFHTEADARAFAASLDSLGADAPAPTPTTEPTPAEPTPPPSLDGLTRGVEITVSSRGETSPGGRFRFDRWHLDGSATCWGPVNSQRAQWRNFRTDRITQVHRKVKDVRAAKEQEAA